MSELLGTDRRTFHALDFFCGSGLVRQGLEPEFKTVWANDNCPKKAEVYKANYPPAEEFNLGDIGNVSGLHMPKAELAWASFPCQDLSLAGNMSGISQGTRSGVFWQWLRVLDEMPLQPPILVAENVVGFLVANEGREFKSAYRALRDRGYRAGAVVVDARLFLPQSRPRAFLVAVRNGIDLQGLTQQAPSHPFHTPSLVRTVARLRDPEWLWWNLTIPSKPIRRFGELCERDARCETPDKTNELRAMLSRQSRERINHIIDSKITIIGTGYRRSRPDDDGRLRQTLELRFDGIAGCLRTPEGGSSRQIVVIIADGKMRMRLMTVRECARLMGAPDTYVLPGSYNDGYRAMGDAVAVPVTRWLTTHLLAPLAIRYRRSRAAA